MKTILFQLDFKEQSDYVVAVAACIAHQIKAEIYLFHVREKPINEEQDPYRHYYNVQGDMGMISGNEKLKENVKKIIYLIPSFLRN